MTAAPFYARKPAPLAADARFWLLLVPAIAATAGSVAYASQGFAVSAGGVLPAAWVESFARWGGVLLAIGCEAGTLSASFEVWRKRAAGGASWLDYAGLAVSFCATVVARVLALSEWRAWWAILALILASAADAYVLLMELGGYAAYADERRARWLAANAQWQAGDPLGAQEILAGAQIARVLAAWPSRRAQLTAIDAHTTRAQAEEPRAQHVEVRVPTAQDWRTLCAGMNGERAQMTAERVLSTLAAHGFASVPDDRARRWARETRAEVNR